VSDEQIEQVADQVCEANAKRIEEYEQFGVLAAVEWTSS